MSERIYAWLLRLYPRRFRESWGEAALELYRDRARDERGFMGRFLLWLDLLSDAAVSIPREYRRTTMELVPARSPGDALPSFRTLGSESPEAGALMLGAMVSLAIAIAFSFSGGRGHVYGAGLPDGIQSGSASQAAGPRPMSRGAGNSARGIGGALQFDAAERRRMVDAVVANLKEHYGNADIARKVTEALQFQEKAGHFETADRAAFAALLTRTMRDASHDASLVVIYSEQPLVEPPQPRPAMLERYREAMMRQNCTFEKVSILRGNIGYVKLNSFPDLSVCGATATAAMTAVNGAKAVIFDLRDNTGGFPETVASIAAWLFDHPEYLYNPREDTTKSSWTRSPVPGSHLADKPVYILTSPRTFSGAEQFTWDLKMLKRATIVGEQTRGGAHAGVFHRLDAHFAVAIPEARPVNPFSDSDWDGIGVEPDVKVNAADALERAGKLAAIRLRQP